MGVRIPIPVPAWSLFAPRGPFDLREWENPQEGVRAVAVDGPGRAVLRGWKVGGPLETVRLLYFYGNGHTLRDSLQKLRFLSNLCGLSAVCFDYRGYGFSRGRPDLNTIREDALRCYDAVAGDAGAVVYGESIGSIFALNVAARRPVRAVVLEAPVASAEIELAYFAQAVLPESIARSIRPVATPATHRGMNNLATMQSVTAPLFVVHGDEDEHVPFEGGRALFKAGRMTEKLFVTAHGAGHTTIALNDPAIAEPLRAFLQTHSGISGNGAGIKG